MRLKAALLGGLALCTSVSCFNDDHHFLAKRIPSPTTTATAHLLGKRAVSSGGVFNAPNGWPTVSIPSGFTLAAGVELTTTTPTPTPTQSGSSIATSLASAPVAINNNDVAPSLKLNSTAWTAEADASCQAAMIALNGQTNSQSGLAACYNLPVVNITTGEFDAEMRVYSIMTPYGDFSNLTVADMSVSMTYPHAAFTELQPSGLSKRATTDGAAAPSLVSTRQYSGQINSDSFSANLSSAKMQALLTPNVFINAKSISNQTLTSQLDLSQTSFVAGVFMKGTTGNLTDTSFLLNNPAQKLLAASQGLPTPFSVPGLILNVFPTGLIFTSVWILLFFITVFVGVIGKIQKRDQYRREERAVQESMVKRF